MKESVDEKSQYNLTCTYFGFKILGHIPKNKAQKEHKIGLSLHIFKSVLIIKSRYFQIIIRQISDQTGSTHRIHKSLSNMFI